MNEMLINLFISLSLFSLFIGTHGYDSLFERDYQLPENSLKNSIEGYIPLYNEDSFFFKPVEENSMNGDNKKIPYIKLKDIKPKRKWNSYLQVKDVTDSIELETNLKSSRNINNNMDQNEYDIYTVEDIEENILTNINNSDLSNISTFNNKDMTITNDENLDIKNEEIYIKSNDEINIIDYNENIPKENFDNIELFDISSASIDNTPLNIQEENKFLSLTTDLTETTMDKITFRSLTSEETECSCSRSQSLSVSDSLCQILCNSLKRNIGPRDSYSALCLPNGCHYNSIKREPRFVGCARVKAINYIGQQLTFDNLCQSICRQSIDESEIPDRWIDNGIPECLNEIRPRNLEHCFLKYHNYQDIVKCGFV